MVDIREIAKEIVSKKKVVVLTGAGVSTPSGIPDFRSKGGLWSRYNPAIYATYSTFRRDPTKYWTMAKETSPTMLNAEPNAMHHAIATLETLGIVQAVITQNVDFLHQRAGSKEVIEIHGTYDTVTCMKCGEKINRRAILDQILDKDPPPLHLSDGCGGIFQPDVILFDQLLDPDVMNRANDAVASCNVLLVVGSSLVVSPANTFPMIAKRLGASVYLFNREETLMDELMDGVIIGNGEETLPELVTLVQETIEDEI